MLPPCIARYNPAKLMEFITDSCDSRMGARAPTFSAPVTELEHDPSEAAHRDNLRLERFSKFLRYLRLAIPVDAKSIGSFVRLPVRIGKVVSQEELAEAIGVSRCWYNMLEAARPVQPSIALIDRLCDALTTDEQQRLRLVELALPAFSQFLSKTVVDECTVVDKQSADI